MLCYKPELPCLLNSIQENVHCMFYTIEWLPLPVVIIESRKYTIIQRVSNTRSYVYKVQQCYQEQCLQAEEG